jgi:hypothetical protein
MQYADECYLPVIMFMSLFSNIHNVSNINISFKNIILSLNPLLIRYVIRSRKSYFFLGHVIFNKIVIRDSSVKWFCDNHKSQLFSHSGKTISISFIENTKCESTILTRFCGDTLWGNCSVAVLRWVERGHTQYCESGWGGNCAEGCNLVAATGVVKRSHASEWACTNALAWLKTQIAIPSVRPSGRRKNARAQTSGISTYP